MQLHLVIL